MRDKNISKKLFKELVEEVALLLTYEGTRTLATEDVTVETPLMETTGARLAGKKLVVVPILRAGLGMAEGVLNMIPSARVGHIGIKRNEETLEPKTYYSNIPHESANRVFLLVDPMLATGGSAIAAANTIKSFGVKKIIFLCLISAPEGVKKFCETHPDIEVFTAALDEKLNDKGYILPGLGDAGDRIFGTKPEN